MHVIEEGDLQAQQLSAFYTVWQSVVEEERLERCYDGRLSNSKTMNRWNTCGVADPVGDSVWEGAFYRYLSFLPMRGISVCNYST